MFFSLCRKKKSVIEDSDESSSKEDEEDKDENGTENGNPQPLCSTPSRDIADLSSSSAESESESDEKVSSIFHFYLQIVAEILSSMYLVEVYSFCEVL